MATVVAVILATICLTAVFGCAQLRPPAPGEPPTQTCQTAQTAYLVYLAVINAGGEPSRDQILAATAAAVFLQQYCGWTPPPITGLHTEDWRGVPVIIFPAK